MGCCKGFIGKVFSNPLGAIGDVVDTVLSNPVQALAVVATAIVAPELLPEVLPEVAGATEAVGLATLPESVLSAEAAFGTGAGTLATDAALAAGAGASGTALGDMAISGLGDVPLADLPIGDQIGDFPTEGSYGTPTAPGVQDAVQNLLDNNALQSLTGSPLETLGDQPGDFPTEGNYGNPTAPGVQDATENLLSNNVLQETAGAPLDSIGDQPGDFPTEGNYGDPTAPGVKDAVQNLLDYNAQYATPGLSTTDALRAANQVKNALTGGTTATTTGTTTTGGLTSGLTGATTSNPFDISGGIQNLTPGLTKATQDYTLAGLPHMAAGSSTNAYTFNDLGNKDATYNPFAVDKFSYIKPGLTQANTRYDLLGLPGYLLGKREGGSIPGHNPEFFSEGGLQHRYVKGQGDGTSDSVPAMLASGEFVIPADVVSGLGNGDNDAGAKVLDEFLRTIRQHKRRADVRKLPPDSKGPLGYLLEAKRKVR